MKKKVSLITAGCIILFATAGYAAVNMYQLENQKGETVYEAKKLENPPSDVLQVLEEYEKKLDLARKSLQPGTAAAVYIATKDPLRRVAEIQKPLVFSNLADLQKTIAHFATLPTQLGTDLAFKEGDVTHPYLEKPNNEALYQEAERTKKDVVTHPLALSKEIDFITCTYGSKAATLTVYIEKYKYDNNQKEYLPNRPNEQIEKVKLNKGEALYKMYANGQDQETQELLWVDSDLGRKYTIQTNDKSILKNDLISIATQFSQAQSQAK